MTDTFTDEFEWPNFLYRYRKSSSEFAFSEIEEAISRKRIYFSNAESLNDPFDFKPIYRPSFLREIVNDLKSTHGNRKIISRERASELTGLNLSRQEFRSYGSINRPGIASASLELATTKKVFEELPAKSYLACLSETHSNIPMWAHYADNHSGFCIKYAFRPIPKIQDDPVPLRVTYATERPVLDTFHIREFTGRTKRTKNSHRKSLEAFSAMFFTKSNQWEYEREWRLLLNGSKGGYKKVTCLEVQEIIFGINTPKDFCHEVARRFGKIVDLTMVLPSSEDYSFELRPYKF